MPKSFDAIVVGGGIHGASTALSLAKRGRKVALLERDGLGSHASGVNAGSIHHIPRIHFELPLAEAALSSWATIADRLEDDCGFRQVGYLKIVSDERELADARGAMTRVRRHSNIPERLLDRHELGALQPGLSGSAVGGIFAPTCGYANPALTMMAFRRQLDRARVALVEGACVKMIEGERSLWRCETDTERWHAPLLVNCAGAWGACLAGLVGEELALSQVAPMMTVTGRIGLILNTVVGLHGQRLSLKQTENGTVLIGGGYQGDIVARTNRTRLDRGRLAYNLALALRTVPALRSVAVVRSWAGIEGLTPDHAPYIGPSLRHERLWHCFGFSTHGFYLGPITGELLAEAIVGGTVPVLLRPFALDRPSIVQRTARAADAASAPAA